LDILSQNNFSNEKQVDLLQILNYALFAKHYPQDICGILDRKIQILQQAQGIPETDDTDVANLKVRAVVIVELLKKMQLGTVHNDLTKICRLIAFLIGNSYYSIYKTMQKGISFTNFHNEQIDKANKILAELTTTISIDKNKQY